MNLACCIYHYISQSFAIKWTSGFETKITYHKNKLSTKVVPCIIDKFGNLHIRKQPTVWEIVFRLTSHQRFSLHGNLSEDDKTLGGRSIQAPLLFLINATRMYEYKWWETRTLKKLPYMDGCFWRFTKHQPEWSPMSMNQLIYTRTPPFSTETLNLNNSKNYLQCESFSVTCSREDLVALETFENNLKRAKEPILHVFDCIYLSIAPTSRGLPSRRSGRLTL